MRSIARMGEWLKSFKPKSHDAKLLESDGDDHEADLKEFDNNIKVQTEVVVNTREEEGFSIVYLQEVTKLVSLMNGHVASAILGCEFEKDILNEEKSFNLAVQEFFHFNQQLLDFCSALDKFVKSTRDSLSYIEYAVQQYLDDNRMDTEYCKKILLNLKNLKASDHDDHALTAEGLQQRVADLMTQFDNVLNNLKLENMKIVQQQKRLQSRKKLTKIVYACSIACTAISVSCLVGAEMLPDIISAAADFASDVSNASQTVDPSPFSPFMESHRDLAQTINEHQHGTEVVAQAASVVIVGVPARAGQHFINNEFKGPENTLTNQKEKIELAANKTQFAIEELGVIKYQIGQVVNEIDSLMLKTNKAVDMENVDFLMKNIKQKLDTFMKKIDDLDKEAVKCSNETLEARNAVRDRIKIKI